MAGLNKQTSKQANKQTNKQILTRHPRRLRILSSPPPQKWDRGSVRRLKLPDPIPEIAICRFPPGAQKNDPPNPISYIIIYQAALTRPPGARPGDHGGSKMKTRKSTTDGKIGDRTIRKKYAKRAGPRPGVVRELIERKSNLVGI